MRTRMPTHCTPRYLKTHTHMLRHKRRRVSIPSHMRMLRRKHKRITAPWYMLRLLRMTPTQGALVCILIISLFIKRCKTSLL